MDGESSILGHFLNEQLLPLVREKPITCVLHATVTDYLRCPDDAAINVGWSDDPKTRLAAGAALFHPYQAGNKTDAGGRDA